MQKLPLRSCSTGFHRASDVEESIQRNLDTQHRRLAEVEAQLDRLLAGDLTSPYPATAVVTPQSYDELTVSNDAVRAERGWSNVDLDDALTPYQREQFAAWQARQRVPWASEDVTAVGFAGMVGMAATWFDSTLDKEVRDRLKELKATELVKGWERDARRMPIDYTGPGFGGPAHRVRSAGHDLGRPLEALRQVRDGQFRGIRWAAGVRTDVSTDVGEPVATIGEALTLWGKHLVADVVTPMSLPLPWWTLLYERPERDVRKFAHDAYSGSAFGEGLNVRSGLLTPTLAVLTTEAILRTHVHGRALMVSGSSRLDPSQQALRTELLLAGHSLVGAACLGKTITGALVTSTKVMAVRHVNLPVLLRIGMLAVQVLRDIHGRRSPAAPDWDMLLRGAAQPWQLDAALKLETTAQQTGLRGYEES